MFSSFPVFQSNRIDEAIELLRDTNTKRDEVDEYVHDTMNAMRNGVWDASPPASFVVDLDESLTLLCARLTMHAGFMYSARHNCHSVSHTEKHEATLFNSSALLTLWASGEAKMERLHVQLMTTLHATPNPKHAETLRDVMKEGF